MKINFEILDVRAFLAIVDLGTFNRAAESLNISQPALSRRIQSLESVVGAVLLERTTRRVATTAAGRSFAPLARRLIGDLEESLLGIAGFGNRITGQIAIACIPTAAFHFLPCAIEKFHKDFPHIKFKISDTSAIEGLESVRRGEVEFGINLLGFSESDLNFTPMVEDPFVVVCRRDHALTRKRRIVWKDLEGERLIGVSRASGNRAILDTALSAAGVSLNFQYEVHHLTTSLGLVEQGLGIAVLTNLAAPQADHSKVVTKVIRAPSVKRTIGLLERRTARLSPVAQRFRDMLIKSR